MKKQLTDRSNPHGKHGNRTSKPRCDGSRTAIFVAVITLLTMTAFASDVWIRPDGTDGTGDGSAANPYVRTTASSFDALMSAMTANTTVHLMAGTFQTAGSLPFFSGWVLQTKERIVGAGMDLTTLQLVSGAPDGTTVISSINGESIEVADLTVDCNYTSGTYTYHGVGLWGTRNAERRVKVNNAAQAS